MSVTVQTCKITTFSFEDNGETRFVTEQNLTDNEIDHLEAWFDYNSIDKFRSYRFRRAFCESLHDMDDNVCFVDDLKDRIALAYAPGAAVLRTSGNSDDVTVSGYRSEDFDYTFDVVAKNLNNRGVIKLHDDAAIEVTRVGKIIFNLAYS